MVWTISAMQDIYYILDHLQIFTKFFLLFIRYQVSLEWSLSCNAWSLFMSIGLLKVSGSLDLVFFSVLGVYSCLSVGCHQLVPMLPFGSICLVLVPWFSSGWKWCMVFVLSYLLNYLFKADKRISHIQNLSRWYNQIWITYLFGGHNYCQEYDFTIILSGQQMCFPIVRLFFDGKIIVWPWQWFFHQEII